MEGEGELVQRPMVDGCPVTPGAARRQASEAGGREEQGSWGGQQVETMECPLGQVSSLILIPTALGSHLRV